MAGHFQNYHFGCRNTTKYDSLDFILCIETAIRMTFRRAGPPCRTPKCHSYCSFNNKYEIERIVLSCISAAKVIILKMARHAARLIVILTAVLIQTVKYTLEKHGAEHMTSYVYRSQHISRSVLVSYIIPIFQYRL